MKNLQNIAISLVGLSSLCFAGVALSQNDSMPDTAQFMSMLNTCAAGSTTEFDGDLLGSIREIYEGQRTHGFAKLRSSSGFLDLLPEAEKLEGYRLYVQCIKAIVTEPGSTLAEVQFDFLANYSRETTFAKVEEAFGAASKVRDMGGGIKARWYEGVDVDFFVLVNKRNESVAAAVFVVGNIEKARIPYLNMGNTIAGKEREFYSLSDFHFEDMRELCDTDEAGEGHTRFWFKVTSDCYFGAPGGYMRFQFVFEPNDDVFTNCDENFIEKTKYSDFTCKYARELQPILALVIFEDENEVLIGSAAHDLMEWRYGW